MKMNEMRLKGKSMLSLLVMSMLALPFVACSNDNNELYDSEKEQEAPTEIQLASALISGTTSPWQAKTRDASYTTVTSTHATINKHDDDESKLYDQALTATDGILKGKVAMFYPTDGTNIDIYLYNGTYEVDGTNNANKLVKNSSKLNVSALEDQTTTANQDASDFIYGQLINQQRRTSNLEVSMEHLMSQFSLTVTAGTDDETKALGLKIKTIELVDLINEATYTVNRESTSYALVNGTTQKTITLYSNGTGYALNSWNGQDASARTLRAIVLPQDMSSKLLKITTDSKTGKTFSYTFPANTSFIKGKKYVYSMTVSAMSLKVTAKVLDWDTQSSVDIEAGYDVP
jgi:hypothetical protein